MENAALSRQQLARHAHTAQTEARRQWHLPVAQGLRAPLLAATIIAAASVQIELGKARKLCSQDYIAGWEALLATPLMAAQLLEQQSDYAAQMRQNSPFVATVRQYLLADATKKIQAAPPRTSPLQGGGLDAIVPLFDSLWQR